MTGIGLSASICGHGSMHIGLANRNACTHELGLRPDGLKTCLPAKTHKAPEENHTLGSSAMVPHRRSAWAQARHVSFGAPSPLPPSAGSRRCRRAPCRVSRRVVAPKGRKRRGGTTSHPQRKKMPGQPHLQWGTVSYRSKSKWVSSPQTGLVGLSYIAWCATIGCVVSRIHRCSTFSVTGTRRELSLPSTRSRHERSHAGAGEWMHAGAYAPACSQEGLAS